MTTPRPTLDPRPFAADWLIGGGEMGELIRSRDWSATPLGPRDLWPQSLRSAISVCLGSRFPIVIYWGPEFIVLYNDAYASILAAKHPRALGERCRDVWAEIWDVIEPMLSSVVATSEATWSDDQLLILQRHGYPEECYFSFSFSPIWAEGGNVGGVFTAVIEHTQRVLSERRLRMLRELADHTADAKSETEACERAGAVLAANPLDVSFALIYLVDGPGHRAELVSTAGGADGLTLATVELAGDDSPWRLGVVTATQRPEVIGDLRSRFVLSPYGPWPEAPDTAVVLPLIVGGHALPAGLLVAGVSSRRRLDDDYRSFFTLVAGHIATGVAKARAYAEERKRAEALAEIDRAKTAFFSNVSHEFRTPLTLMLGPVVDMLARSPDQMAAEDRELLSVVHRNGMRLQKLVNTLLDFSRIEAGRVSAVYEPTDLGALTAEIASNFRAACERAGLRLVTDCPSLGEPVYVDRDMWEKIVLNLVSNAFKFTFEGEITVTVRPAAGAVELTVRDTGIGIAPDEIPHLFERFHRVEGARGRTHEGTGIGLALVQELVKLHRGATRVESSPGQGSRFVVSIPQGKAHLPADRIGGARTPTTAAPGAWAYVEEALRWLPEGEPGGPTGNAAAVEHPRARILWADDNADMRDYVRRLLASRYDVEAVADGKAALAAARANPPDLVLSDVMMPNLDGFQLLRELRADPATRTLPVILLSARAGEESHVEGFEAGADDYLIKPFSARELLTRVAAHLKMARVRRDAEAVLRAADRAKDEFLAMLSHELRNPLGAIGSAVRVLADATKPNPTLARAHAVIDRQVAHLARLVDDLLDVGRVTAGKIVLDCRPLDLAEIVTGVVSAWRAAGQPGPRAVTVRTESVWVEADETRLEQVVTNLVANALKFTPPEGSVTVSVRAEHREAVLEVQDTGIGMTPDLIGRVFDLFAQGVQTPDRAHGGLGIGLTLVRHLVERHGGTVTAHSAGPGRGSVFTVRLPAIETPSRPLTSAPERRASAPRRVLIVEDNEDAREMMRFALEYEGHTVLTAADGPAGITLAASAGPDIALIDIGLPGVDGYEVARRIRAVRGRTITLVALTGYGGSDDRERAEQAGFDVHLVKPVEPAKLADVIGAAPDSPNLTASS
jgi:signal transduction histidine kinase